MNPSAFNILIVDDNERNRSYLRSFSSDGRFNVVAEAGNSENALNYLVKQPDINLIILDYLLINSTLDGKQLAKVIRKYYPDKKIYFWTEHFSLGNLIEVEKICDGVIPKHYTKDQIAFFLNKDLQHKMVEFTDREMELLHYLSNGYSNRSIAIVHLDNQEIEKYFEEKIIRGVNDGDDKGSSCIENTFNYYREFSPKTEIVDDSTKLKKLAIQFRKAIRSLPADNSSYIKEEIPEQRFDYPMIRSEIPLTIVGSVLPDTQLTWLDWNNEIHILDSQIESYIKQNPAIETTLDINELIKKYFDENKERLNKTIPHLKEVIEDSDDFVQKVRKSGYLSYREIIKLCKNLEEWINERISDVRKKLKYRKIENHIIKIFYRNNDINKNKSIEYFILGPLEEIPNNPETVLPSKARNFPLTIEPHERIEAEIKERLKKFINDERLLILGHFKDINDYPNNNTIRRSDYDTDAEFKKKRNEQIKLICDYKGISNELYTLYVNYIDSEPYDNILRQIEKRCSNLMDKIRRKEIALVDSRATLVHFATDKFKWKPNEYDLITYMHSIRESFKVRDFVEINYAIDGKDVSNIDVEFSAKINAAFIKTANTIFWYYTYLELLNGFGKIILNLSIYKSRKINFSITFEDKSSKLNEISIFPNEELLRAQMKSVSGNFDFKFINNSHIFELSAPLPK